jgi:hypothetical protein
MSTVFCGVGVVVLAGVVIAVVGALLIDRAQREIDSMRFGLDEEY